MIESIAQLFSVPRTLVPLGSSIVFNRSSPAAGPPILIGVCPVIRRAYRESRTTCQSLFFFESRLRQRGPSGR